MYYFLYRIYVSLPKGHWALQMDKRQIIFVSPADFIGVSCLSFNVLLGPFPNNKQRPCKSLRLCGDFPHIFFFRSHNYSHYNIWLTLYCSIFCSLYVIFNLKLRVLFRLQLKKRTKYEFCMFILYLYVLKYDWGWQKTNKKLYVLQIQFSIFTPKKMEPFVVYSQYMYVYAFHSLVPRMKNIFKIYNFKYV